MPTRDNLLNEYKLAPSINFVYGCVNPWKNKANVSYAGHAENIVRRAINTSPCTYKPNDKTSGMKVLLYHN